MKNEYTNKYMNHFPEKFQKDFLQPSGLSFAELADHISLDKDYLEKIIQNSRELSRIVSAKLGRFFGKPDMYFFNLQDELDAPYRTETFTLSKEEVSFLIKALDMYSRVWMGQYDNLSFEARFLLPSDVNWSVINQNEEKRNAFFKKIRNIVLPELKGWGMNASHGIFSPDVNPLATDAYDMQQVLRFVTAYYVNPEGGITINFREPMIRGRFPRIVCHITGPKDTYQVQIEMTEEQRKICSDALLVYDAFLKEDYHTLFSFFTSDKEALALAEECEIYNYGTILPQKNMENLYQTMVVSNHN